MSERRSSGGYIRESDDVKLHLALYLAIAVAGAAAIVFLKRAEVGQWTVTFVPVSLMFVYLGAVIAVPRWRLRLDVAGDNLYYLGFTYTLVSLGVALYEFASLSDVRIALIQNFGIALTSTIVGIVLRLALNQLRRDPLEIERESRRQLADASRDLRTQLGEASLEFVQFQTNLRQSMMDSHAEMREQIANTLEKGLKSFEGIAAQTVKSIEQSYEELSRRAGEINHLTGTVVGALGTLAGRIEAVRLPADIIEQQLRPAVDLMRRLADEIAATQRNEAEERDRFRQGMKDLAEIAASASETRRRQLEEAADAQSRMREQGQALAAVVAELNGFAASIGGMRGKLIDGIERGHADLAQHAGTLARVSGDLAAAAQASLAAARIMEGAARTAAAPPPARPAFDDAPPSRARPAPGSEPDRGTVVQTDLTADARPTAPVAPAPVRSPPAAAREPWVTGTDPVRTEDVRPAGEAPGGLRSDPGPVSRPMPSGPQEGPSTARPESEPPKPPPRTGFRKWFGS